MSLGRWAERVAKADVRAQAQDELRDLPTSDRGYGTEVPFPYAEREAYKQGLSNRGVREAIESAPITRIPIQNLNAIQRTIRARTVREYIEDPDLVPEGTRHARHKGLVDLPIVVQRGGIRYIHDGHHRLTAAKLRGEDAATVRLVDLDETGPKKGSTE